MRDCLLRRSLRLENQAIAKKLEKFRAAQTKTVLKGPDPRK